jgi:hypothetical protein
MGYSGEQFTKSALSVKEGEFIVMRESQYRSHMEAKEM